MKKLLIVICLSSLAWAQFAVGTMVEYNQGATWAPAEILGQISGGYRLRVKPPHGSPYDVVSTYATVRPAQSAPAQPTQQPQPMSPTQGPATTMPAAVGQQLEYNQGATWAPAEVVGQIPGGYRLRVTPPNGPPYDAVSTYATVRTPQNPAPPLAQAQPAPPRQPDTRAQPQAQPQVADANAARLDNTNTQGNVPTPRIIEAVMRSMWEKPADPGMDGAVTTSFQSIAIGATRPWTVLDGNQGTPGTTVWAAKVNWTHTTHYRTRNRVLVRKWTVSVFKNSLGNWVVQSTASTPQDETVREDPPDMR